MKKRDIARLMPGEALKRIKSAQTIVVIGPTSSGKSTFIYALVNHRIIGFILVGIGDECQTTIIPCNFLFDERIEKDEYFSMKIRTKEFSAKAIHLEILEMLAKQFTVNGMCAEDTFDEIDEEVFQSILEPDDAAYHLGKISDKVSLEIFKNVVADALSEIEEASPSFNERVKAKKKELDKQKVVMSTIRRMVFEDMWNELDSELLSDYYVWLDSIGTEIMNMLNILVGTGNGIGKINEYSVKQDDILPYGGLILQTLFDPFQPYSLVVEDIVLACRPRKELIEKADEDIPLRFCLRDTMGLNQIDMDDNSIKDALDIALNCSPDSILLLMNLEERDDVIADCCDVIGEKIGKAKKLDVPVNVIFTKADRIIGNIINKAEKATVELTQADYNKNMERAISSMETSIERYLTKLPQNSATWLSIRYLEESIDPIQIALKTLKSDKLVKFKPEGLYQKIDEVIRDTQTRILPKGMKAPVFVTVIDAEKPAVRLKVDGSLISNVFKQMQLSLTEDKAIVNGYTITTKYIISGRSVVTYYNKLKRGQGHTTRAYVYGNFSINMKAMLNKVLCNTIPDFATLYESEVVSTLADNLEESEVDRMIEAFDENHEITEFAFADINPAIFDGLPAKLRKIQKLHWIFRHYFNSSEKYYMVMDKVAFNLSYGNKRIQNIIDKVYSKPISYDATIREMQETFKKVFETRNFADIIAEEIGATMTELVNKMFIII
jgi:GTP-binding protein EngB required for normal cell division